MVNAMTAARAFIGCDWGSTSFRLRLVETPSRRVLAEQSAPAGVKTFAALPAAERAERMARFLAERLALWPEVGVEVPIVVTGMASSNVGWRELPYAAAPFPLDGSRAETARVEFAGTAGRIRRALLCSGVRTEDDVMRGEECALIGAHALHPELAAGERATLCLLAGTHPKHAVLRDGALRTFRTHLTGELFDVLTRASLLAGSVAREASEAPPDLDEFRAGVACARERGAEAGLFQVRARHLLRQTPPAANTWFLSGVLLGGELSRVEALAPGARLGLIGDPTRIALYRATLAELGIAQRMGEPATVALADAVVAGQETLVRRHAAEFFRP